MDHFQPQDNDLILPNGNQLRSSVLPNVPDYVYPGKGYRHLCDARRVPTVALGAAIEDRKPHVAQRATVSEIERHARSVHADLS